MNIFKWLFGKRSPKDVPPTKKNLEHANTINSKHETLTSRSNMQGLEELSLKDLKTIMRSIDTEPKVTHFESSNKIDELDILNSEAVITFLMENLNVQKRNQIVEKITNKNDRQKIINDILLIYNKEKSDRAFDALSAFGSEAIEPLLSIYNTSPKSALAFNIVIAVKDVNILKSKMTDDHFEKFLLKAFKYGNPIKESNILKAFAEIGSSEAIEQLIFVISQYGWSEESKRPAVEALASLGKKVHLKLLNELNADKAIKGGLEFQTPFRKQILNVLTISGDSDCISMIINVSKKDATITNEAKNALKAITNRNPTVIVPESLEPVPMKIKSPPSSGNGYIDACFHFEFEELDEGRDWREIDDMKNIPSLAREGNIDKALALALRASQLYSDHEFLYLWIGNLKKELGYSGEPLKTFKEGLYRCRSKISLCSEIGNVSFEGNDLPEAVKWWIKSCSLQLGGGRSIDGLPFLHLAYIVMYLGLTEESYNLLKNKSTQIYGSPRGLSYDEANKSSKLTRSQGNNSIRLALTRFVDYYLKSPHLLS